MTRMHHHRLFFLFTLAAGLFLWNACEGDYRRSAQGGFSEIIVVMDSTEWDSPTADAIRATFGRERMTLPRPEARYDLRFMDLRTNRDLEYVKNFKNTIFAAPLEEESNVGAFIRAVMSDDIKQRIADGRNFAFPLKDRWYRDQWTLFLSATDHETLSRRIRESEKSLVGYLDELERERWQREIYRRGEQVHLADSLMKNHGFRIRVQHDYRIGVDTTNFVSMRRYLHDNDRWIWFAWFDDKDGMDGIDQEWINAVRDSLNEKYIRGTREESFVTTEYRRAIETIETRINGKPALETRGTWRMTNDLMGGPFLHYTVYDENQRRIYMMEFAQFAPRHSKRRFMNQFEAMAYTFETASPEELEALAGSR
ncbi:DUF4837 family protein [Balneolales bacterium ANBcel1]|nr:DUF4837 family protein [Balneolales bacterium ANBcel1]